MNIPTYKQFLKGRKIKFRVWNSYINIKDYEIRVCDKRIMIKVFNHPQGKYSLEITRLKEETYNELVGYCEKLKSGEICCRFGEYNNPHAKEYGIKGE